LNYETPEGFLRKNIKNLKIESVADIGTGHGGIFDYWFWEKQNLKLKVCLDVYYIRPDINESWHKIIASATHLPFKNEVFDLTISCEMIEHVPQHQHEKVLKELKRVSRKAIFITSTDETAHRGEAQKKAEEWNPFNKYLEMVDPELLKKLGFRILLYNGHKVKAFLRLS